MHIISTQRLRVSYMYDLHKCSNGIRAYVPTQAALVSRTAGLQSPISLSRGLSAQAPSTATTEVVAPEAPCDVLVAMLLVVHQVSAMLVAFRLIHR
jgi:hypothetical protein